MMTAMPTGQMAPAGFCPSNPHPPRSLLGRAWRAARHQPNRHDDPRAGGPGQPERASQSGPPARTCPASRKAASGGGSTTTRRRRTAPQATAVTEAGAPGPNTERAASGKPAKQAVASAPAIRAPPPNGCSRWVAANWASGTRLVMVIATAHPMAAPVIPYFGISRRSRLTLTATAISPLARLQLLRPEVIRTMSTWPHAVASSMVAENDHNRAAGPVGMAEEAEDLRPVHHGQQVQRPGQQHQPPGSDLVQDVGRAAVPDGEQLGEARLGCHADRCVAELPGDQETCRSRVNGGLRRAAHDRDQHDVDPLNGDLGE